MVWRWLLVTFLVVFTEYSGFSQKTEKIYYHDSTTWSLDVPLWVPGVTGQFSYGEFSFSGIPGREEKDRNKVNKNFGIEFYFGGRFVKRYKNFWFLADVFSGRIRNTFTVTSDRVSFESQLIDMTIQGIVPRVVGGYKVFEHAKNDFRIQLVPYVGARYLDLQLKSTFIDSAFSVSLTPKWFEPIIGLYIPLYYKAMKLDIQADWGTNGGNSSFILNSYLSYRISKLIDVKGGWALLIVQHKNEFLGRPLKANLGLTGPTLGIGFHL